MSETETNQVNFSKYGIYEIDDSLNLTLPNTEIKITKVGKNVFAYARKDSEDNLMEKLIPTNSEKLTIELAPIRPLNYPTNRTNSVYLELETPIFLHEGSSATVFIRCPIEIGVFYVHNGSKDSLDCFTCDPLNSRFCLYGLPESGTLCKYYKSEIVESYEDSIPYVNGVLTVSFQNTLPKGLSVGRIVFSISDNSLYYENSKTIIDSINVVLKKKLTIEIQDVESSQIDTTWTKSPTYEKVQSIKRVDMGVD